MKATEDVFTTFVFPSRQAFEDRVKGAIRGAIASRGKNKGRLKSQCPPVGSDEAAAWQAMMRFANPYKVGMCHLFFMPLEQKAIYEYLCKVIKEKAIDVRGLDRDRAILEDLGVW